MRSRDGYTVTELMVGVVIVGILAAASVPSVSGFMRSQNATSGTEQLGAHMRMARSRAILEGNDYLLQFTGNNQYQIVDDDGGGNGIPGAAGFVAANRNNETADTGELVYGPYTLPHDMRFSTVSGIKNPFTHATMDAAVTFPEVNSVRTVVFHSNGTAEDGGFVAIAPQTDVDKGSSARTRVLQLAASTGAVQALPAGQ